MKKRRIFGLFRQLLKPLLTTLVLCCAVFSDVSANSLSELYSSFKEKFPATDSNTVTLDFRHNPNNEIINTSNATYTKLYHNETYITYPNEFCVLYEVQKGFQANNPILFALSAKGTFRVRWGDGEIWKIEKRNTDLVFFRHRYPGSNEPPYPLNDASFWWTNTGVAQAYGVTRTTICISRDESVAVPEYSTITQNVSYDSDITSATVTTPAVIFSGIYNDYHTPTLPFIRSVSGNLASVFPVNTNKNSVPSFAGTFLGNTVLGSDDKVCAVCDNYSPAKLITNEMFNGLNKTTVGQFAFTFAGCSNNKISELGSTGVFGGVSGDTQKYLFAGTFWNNGLTRLPDLGDGNIKGAPKEGLFMATVRGNPGITGQVDPFFSVITGSGRSVPAFMFQETFSGCSGLGTNDGTTTDPSLYINYDFFKNKFTSADMGVNAMHHIFWNTKLPIECPIGKKEIDKIKPNNEYNEPYYTFSSWWLKSGSLSDLVMNAVSCEPCPAGTYSDSVGNTCTVCAKGMYNALTGRAACTGSCSTETNGVYPTTYSQETGATAHDHITDCLASVTFKGMGGKVMNDSRQDWTVYAKYPQSTSYVNSCSFGTKTLCKVTNSLYRITDGVADTNNDGRIDTEWTRQGFKFGGWWQKTQNVTENECNSINGTYNATAATCTKSGLCPSKWTKIENECVPDAKVRQVEATTDLTGSQALYAKWYITCAPAEYLPANSTTCTPCTTDNYCPGGDYVQSTDTQGIYACADTSANGGTNGVYPKTWSGAYANKTSCLAKVNFYGRGGTVTKNSSGVNSDTWTVGAKYVNNTSYENSCFLGTDKYFCQSSSSNYKITDGVTDNTNWQYSTFKFGGWWYQNTPTTAAECTGIGGTYQSGQKYCSVNGVCPSGWLKLREDTATDTAGNNVCAPVAKLTKVTQDMTFTGDKSLYADWQIHCNAGRYLPANSEACASCPAVSSGQGYYCDTAGWYSINYPDPQGNKDCPADYPLSAQNNDSEDMCYARFDFYAGKGSSFIGAGNQPKGPDWWNRDDKYYSVGLFYRATRGWFNYSTETSKRTLKSDFISGDKKPERSGYVFDGWVWQRRNVTSCPAGTTLTQDNRGCAMDSGTTTCPSAHTYVSGLCIPDDKLISLTSTTALESDEQNNVYAKWTPATYTVNYKCDPESATVHGTQPIQYGDTFTAVSGQLCQDLGYSFSVWGCTYDDNTILENGTTYSRPDNATCTAIVNATQMLYTCEGSGHTVSNFAIYNQDYTIPMVSELCPDPTTFGYSYTGDALQDEFSCTGSITSGTYTPWTINTPTIECVATAAPIDYTIHYDYDNGSLPSGVTNPVIYTAEQSKSFNNPERDDCEFVGWCLYNSNANDGHYCAEDSQYYIPPQVIGEDTEIAIPVGTVGDRWAYAKWKCNIHYVLDGGEASNVSDYAVEDDVVLHNPILYGNTFGGWCKYSAAQSSGGNSCSTSDSNYIMPQDNPVDPTNPVIAIAQHTETGPRWFYAKWTPTDYEVTYDCGTASGIPPTHGASGQQAFGETFTWANDTGANCSKTGHSFAGWLCEYLDGAEEDANTPLYDNTTYNIAANASCVAQWEANTISLLWNNIVNTATTTADGSNSCKFGERAETQYGITVQQTSRPGYTFNGWYIDD